MKGFPPVAVEVPRGRVLMVGSADKVDQTRDGVLLVTDIKTGSARTFMVLNDDPVAAGTKLQLPVYAHMYSIAPETTAEPAAGFDWWTSLVGPAVVAAVVAGGGLAEDRRAQEKRRGDPAQPAGQSPRTARRRYAPTSHHLWNRGRLPTPFWDLRLLCALPRRAQPCERSLLGCSEAVKKAVAGVTECCHQDRRRSP